MAMASLTEIKTAVLTFTNINELLVMHTKRCNVNDILPIFVLDSIF